MVHLFGLLFTFNYYVLHSDLDEERLPGEAVQIFVFCNHFVLHCGLGSERMVSVVQLIGLLSYFPILFNKVAYGSEILESVVQL